MPTPDLTALSVPALHLVTAGGAAVFSRIGGRPQLPADVEWPRWKDAPLAFLAQIDLSELPANAPRHGLPDAGCLWFFYDAEQSTWGFDPADAGSWQVLFAQKRPTETPRPLPTDLPDGGEFNALPITFRPISVLPSLERAGVDVSGLGNDACDAIDAARQAPFNGRPHHQIGGFPDPVQGDDMALECQLVSNGLYCGNADGYNDPRASALAQDADAWTLLLQLDTDDDAGMMWGDCGRLYFWIRKDDLARRDFSRVWLVLQCS